ncbi:MAG: zinc ABC transporter substrate-binding protein [Desulfobulbaceae bacterium]|nr:zinc ABC transporter substrate-binding protein [Desulfobulbaceae bacterium]
MQKKNALLLLVMAMLTTLLFSTRPAKAGLKVFACEPEWGALAEELGGELLDISIATTGRQDPHHIQARPSLLARARRADLLICTGAELEVGWLPLLIRKSGNPKIQQGNAGFFMATDYISLREIPTHLDRSDGDVHASGNPHIQTDPNNILQVATALADRLEKLDPDNADAYRERYRIFADRWHTALKKWNSTASSLSGIPVIVHHKSWSYLVNWLGLNEVATLEPKPGVPPNSGHLAKVLNMVQKNPVRAIIFAEYEDPRSAQWLAKQSGIPLASLPFTVGGSEDASDLFSLFDSTLRRLQEVAK